MILEYNKQIIQKTLGRQGSSQCGVYCIAYGWSILEKSCRVSGSPASNREVAKKYNPSSFDECYWGEDGLVSHKANSIKDRYSAIISQLKNGRPVVVAVKGSSYNHYVLVIGVKNGKTSSNVSPSDFYIIDPADAKIGYYGTTWADGSGFNKSTYGLQYCTFDTNKKANTSNSSAPSNVRSNAEVISGVLAFAKKIADDNTYGYKVYNGGNGRLCPICHPGSGNGWNCIGFITACYYHGGGLNNIRIRCSNEGFLNDNWANTNLTLSTWNARNGPGWIEVTKGYRENNISISRLKAGDVFVGFNSASGNSYQHTFMYYGNDKVVDSTGSGDSIAIRGYSGRYTRFYSRVFRFVADATGTPYASSGVDEGQGIDMRQAISKLYSSENYKYLSKKEEDKESKASKFTSTIQKYIKDINFTPDAINSEAIPEPIINSVLPSAKFEKDKPNKILTGTSTQLLSYPTWVEAPTIVLDFNGIKIGGYKNKGDIYPNYITSMSVNKINGQINRYTFNLTYQVRPGEDPNFIDKLISRTGYLKPLKVLYGDSNYPNRYYKEESAIIIDARHSEDVSSYRINYTILAISSIGAAQTSLTTFKEKTDKPSNIIYDLLYNSGNISKNLIDLFPGMRNKATVFSKGLIPTTDSVVTVGGMSNASPLSYLSHLVACMNNVTSNSTYFLTLIDNTFSDLDGAYFKIDEVRSYNKTLSKNTKITQNYFELDIGFPTDNFITNFQLCTNNYWPLVYEYAGNIPKYTYDIDNNGNIIQEKTNALFINKYNETSLITSNWWKQVTEFPISAKVTIKGLLNPAMLMSYIKINTLFYGQRDIASGLYVVTEQQDTISGSGYSTELTLLRVAGDS